MNLHTTKCIKFPFGFWAGLEQLGIAPRDVARQARLPLTVITEPKVTADEYFAIWQAFSDLTGDIAKGIIGLVTVFETAQYPPDVLATYHARDYRDALGRMVRYKQMCPPEKLLITEEGEACTIELEWQHTEESGPEILVGITLAYLLELGRRGTGQALNARSVEIRQPMGDVQMLEAYFGCPVHIGTNRNRLTLQRRDLDIPFTTYNEELLEMLTPVLDRKLSEKQISPSVTETVKWIIKRSLMAGRLDIQSVAKELNMSDRTLQRRLTEEGTSFKHLLTQARHEQAREYLADPLLDIKEVACLVGYEDQNSFYRAFRMWEGDTPSHWRSVNAGSPHGKV
ncbi:helix-turn-helix transcriptional regulator [Paenibacillus whitsoniae]|uniref:AraC family transcriptional regulator n=1 Tax=Paenibacillus whitsoniae TaxID=2496558 RepID=A0A430J934_9BACL|nr:AraC family transcriptional regulator [Paenibacillus whitsoniae]RTE07016.1 AraC family transcriptional regulator [Paenibacillus whitsoniae]